ncbi:hypothetical protein AMTR_s00081p00147610 [Amborella trichopoda]|uniref:Uncharacterized protein n=1 Tax=Amborella trichopoda TaxID=13333 RepID=W1PA97_AMBTC|nr:hypothetical protein AMTR_s00081p00147610 [Amborella trichopoda]
MICSKPVSDPSISTHVWLAKTIRTRGVDFTRIYNSWGASKLVQASEVSNKRNTYSWSMAKVIRTRAGGVSNPRKSNCRSIIGVLETRADGASNTRKTNYWSF